jgi:hypothetical protein
VTSQCSAYASFGERRLDVIEFLEVAEALRIDPFDLLKKLMPTTPKRRPRA